MRPHPLLAAMTLVLNKLLTLLMVSFRLKALRAYFWNQANRHPCIRSRQLLFPCFRKYFRRFNRRPQERKADTVSSPMTPLTTSAIEAYPPPWTITHHIHSGSTTYPFHAILPLPASLSKPAKLGGPPRMSCWWTPLTLRGTHRRYNWNPRSCLIQTLVMSKPSKLCPSTMSVHRRRKQGAIPRVLPPINSKTPLIRRWRRVHIQIPHGVFRHANSAARIHPSFLATSGLLVERTRTRRARSHAASVEGSSLGPITLLDIRRVANVEWRR